MVRVVWAAARVEAAVRVAREVVRVGKTLVVLAQEPQPGMPYSLPLNRPGQPQHRYHR